MARSYSLAKRTPTLVDVRVSQKATVQSYIFKASANFDGSFTNLQAVPIYGFKSPSVDLSGFDASNSSRNQTRFIFNPDDYTVGSSFVSNSKTFWLKVAEIIGGVEQTAGPAHMVLPFDGCVERIIAMSGSAPNGASIANSMEIQLPSQCVGTRIQNNSSNPLMIAFNLNGPEITISPLATHFEPLYSSAPIVHQIFVRGAGGTAAFDAVFTTRNGRI